ncbi:MAG: DCC1-like thiol-disulfide oxidoreductase family protein [Thermodesulfovibrionia bacterium]
MDHRHIILFDGICNFCNSAVNFIIKRDPKGIFVFAPLQSGLARDILHEHNLNYIGNDTFILIKNNNCFSRSNAVLEIVKDLNGNWYLLNLFKIIPLFFRDILYKIFAHNRYKIFGRRSECMVPSNDLKQRFLGI